MVLWLSHFSQFTAHFLTCRWPYWNITVSSKIWYTSSFNTTLIIKYDAHSQSHFTSYSGTVTGAILGTQTVYISHILRLISHTHTHTHTHTQKQQTGELPETVQPDSSFTFHLHYFQFQSLNKIYTPILLANQAFEGCHVACNATQFNRYSQPPIQGSVSIFRMEDIGSSFYIDDSTRVPDYTESHTRIQQCSVTCVIRNVTRVRWARHGPHACNTEWHRDKGIDYASSIARTGQWQNKNNTNYYSCFFTIIYVPASLLK